MTVLDVSFYLEGFLGGRLLSPKDSKFVDETILDDLIFFWPEIREGLGWGPVGEATKEVSVGVDLDYGCNPVTWELVPVKQVGNDSSKGEHEPMIAIRAYIRHPTKEEDLIFRTMRPVRMIEELHISERRGSEE
jgi:hypothetical protein